MPRRKRRIKDEFAGDDGEDDDEKSNQKKPPEDLSKVVVQYTTTSRGKAALYAEGYIYTMNSKTDKGRSYWCCQNRDTCSSRLNLDKDGVVTKRTPHTHDPRPEEFFGLMFKEALLSEVKNSIEPMPRIYEKVKEKLITTRIDMEIPLPSYQSMKSIMYRVREKQQSADLSSLPKHAKTIEGDDWLIFDEEVMCNNTKQRMVIFVDNFMLQVLANSSEWFGDGTFDAAPNGFQQLFSIHCNFNGETLPAVYALLPGKKQEVYVQMLKVIKAKMHSIGASQKGPDILHVDFEKAVHNAFKQVFPVTTIVGCYFHFAQAHFRKVRSLMQSRYVEEPKLRVYIRQIWALALLPLREVPSTFNELSSNSNKEDKSLQSYLRYVRANWIKARFPPKLWNVSCQEHRTNNALEAWHRRINALLESSGPRFDRLMQRLKKEQLLAKKRAIDLENGMPPKPKSRKAVLVEHGLSQAKAAYSANQLSRLEFLKRCSQFLRKKK